MLTEEIVKRLSFHQRDLLVEHVRCPQPIDYSVGTGATNARRTWLSLMDLALVTGDGPASMVKPRATVLTDLGREVAAMLLGQYADALVRAGCLDEVAAIRLDQTSPKEAAMIAATPLTVD